MDNLRGYGEDEPSSSSSLGRSGAKLPSSSEGPSAPLPAQASVMAGSSPAVVPVTSGPVPTVSAPSQPASSVPQDSAPPPPGLLDDLSPPPPPAQPYEDFMARVGCELSTLPAHTTQPVAAVHPRASVTATTTGTRLPKVRGHFLGFPAPGPKHQDPDASSSFLLHSSSIALGVARTGLLRCHFHGACIPACFVAGCPHRTSWTFRMFCRTFPRGPFPCSSTYGSCFTAGCPHRTSWTSRTFRRTFPRGPFPCSTSFGSCSWSKNDLFYPPRFRGFFPGATPPFIQTTTTSAPSSCSSVNSVNPAMTQQDAGTISQGPTPEMIQGWKEEFMVDMKAYWQQFVGDAPPQQTVGPAVPPVNMGPDSLRQLSPSDDREASRAQRKAGSKRAGSSVRRRSRSSGRSSTDRSRARVRRPQVSPDSSSPTRHLSHPAKRSWWDKRDVSRETSSSEGRQGSPRTRRPWRSRSPLPRRRGPSPHRRSRNSPAPSRCPFGANMTRRLAGRPSLSAFTYSSSAVPTIIPGSSVIPSVPNQGPSSSSNPIVLQVTFTSRT